MVYGSACGLAIYGSCHLIEVTAVRRLYRDRTPPKAVRALFYLVGGEVGYLVATVVLHAAGLMPFTLEARDLEIALLINGAAAIVIGLLFSSFAALQRRLRESVERIKEQEFAEKELALAREIQTRLLPPENLEGNGYAVAARNIAARFVAGDFYDVFRLSTGELGISVADVSGKGIGASLIMASVKAVLAMMAEGRRASEALTELNVKLSRELGAREFVALAYARFDPASGKLEIANAGLPDPYLVRPDGTVETISVPGPRLPLGARPNIAYESFTTSLKPGERVFFLTDGLPEAETAKDEPLGYEALESLLPRRAASPSLFIDQLFSTLRASTSPTLGDDWTALVLEARSRRSE
jgi:serine phosphatase RsbU (regulator of sigma subunit)